MDIVEFFKNPISTTHKQFEALRMFFVEEKTAFEVANKFGYTENTIYTLIRDLRIKLKRSLDDPFFIKKSAGRKIKAETNKAKEIIIALRKKYFSVQDIKTVLDAQQIKVSEKQIHNILKQEGFARLPRRSKSAKKQVMASIQLPATQSSLLENKSDAFYSQERTGVLCLIPYIHFFGIDKIIEQSGFPGTKAIPALNSILSFAALKLSNIRRYSSDNIWCMDKSLGLFAGLNVLPKTAWFTSYSHRVTREMNINLLRKLNEIWIKNDLLSDTANLDFVAVPYWGDASHLENNWSGKRNKSLSSMLAAVSQDPDSGIITYGDTTVKHNNDDKVVVEFLDFYKSAGGINLKYLIFDSKFTTYQNLKKLDDDGVKFITIRRRSQNMVDRLNNLDKKSWKTVRIPCANKHRQIKVFGENVFIKDYGGIIRQISITGNGKIKPAIIITNDFDLKVENIAHKYARRWIVEKSISEQTHFFHLNNISSSMVIKVDFDLSMTILAYNLFRLFAQDLPGYNHCAPATLYEKFILNGGSVNITNNTITIGLKKKRHLPAILTAMKRFQQMKISWLHNKKIEFIGESYS